MTGHAIAIEPERPAAVVDGSATDAQFQGFDARLRALLGEAAEREDPTLLAQRLEAYFEVAGLRQEQRERELFDRLETLTRIQESLDELRASESPEELIEATPRELCRACGFSRALISRVNGSRWIPEAIETHAPPQSRSGPFAAYEDGTEIPLDHILPEAELIRRRMPALIEADPPYVAAPIMPTGRVIGFLHGDRFGQEEPLTADDRDNLWTFADQFGFVYERAVLLKRLGAQRDHLHQAFAGAERVVDELMERQIELTRSQREAAQVSRTATALLRPPESRLDGLLTRREREVLELMTSGFTNTRIAEQLVISEGTVKSHVKHILRKLRAGNRAEAVARYLQIMLREQEEAGRR